MSKYTYGKDIRSLYSGGGSLVVTIPTEFLQNHGLEAGDRVELIYGEVLQLHPIKRRDIEKDLKNENREGKENGERNQDR